MTANTPGTTTEWRWGRHDDDDDWHAPCQRLELVDDRKPFSRRQLAALHLSGMQFGSWDGPQEYCLNTDMVGLSTGAEVTAPGSLYLVDDRFYFIQLDARRPLPFEAKCVDWVYAEHFIEHLSLEDGVSWACEVNRILGPGGLVRLTTPDLRRYAEGYVNEDGFFERHRRRLEQMGAGPDVPTRKAFMMNQIFMFYGHRWLYDEDELRFLLTQAGFGSEGFAVRAFRDGARAEVAALDRAERNDETLYVEATATV